MATSVDQLERELPMLSRKGLSSTGRCALIVAALVLAGCGATPQGSFATANGKTGFDFTDLGTLAGPDAGGKDQVAAGKGDGAAGDAEDATQAGDTELALGTDDSTGVGEDAASDDAADPTEDESADAIDLDEQVEPGEDTAESLQDGVEDTKPPYGGLPDTGEDPNNPWYSNPIPDEYTLPDLPDTGDTASDTNGQVMPPLCSPKTASLSVTETYGPGGKLDIIIWVDTSGSMTEEAKWVSTNISKFAGFVATKKIDYRIVLVGKTSGAVALCAGPPLGTGSPLCDTANPAVFMTVKKPIMSTDGLSKLLAYYPDFKAFLRPDAVKNIIAVTDDNSTLSAANFTAQWNALQPVGGAKFVFHGIISYNNEANPFASTSTCSTGASLSKVYLDLAKQTGGYTFQLCKPDWTPAFDALAQAVAATAKAVCTYKIPVDSSVAYTPSAVKILHIENGSAVALPNVCGPEACAGAPTGWYYDDPKNPTTVTLCPDKCKALVGGALAFNFGCAMSGPSKASDAGSTDTSTDTSGSDADDVKVGSCDTGP